MNKKVGLKAFLSFLIYIFGTVLVSVIISIIYKVFGSLTGIANELVMALGGVVVTVLIILHSKIDLKNEFNNFKSNWKNCLKTIYKTWGLGFILLVVVNLIINYLIMGGIAPNEATNREILFASPFYAVINICLLAPIMEEIIFRYNLKGISKNKRGYILISGITFGLMHIIFSELSLANLIYLIPYSLLGLIFAKVYTDTDDNLCSSVLAHMTQNTLSVIVILLGV